MSHTARGDVYVFLFAFPVFYMFFFFHHLSIDEHIIAR